MNQIDEGSLAAYIDRFLASKSRLLDQRFFRGKVSNVVKSSPTPAYQCQVIPVGSTTPLSLLCCTPSYVPAVGDDVECVWRDQNTGYLLWPVTGVTGAAGVGFANPMTTAGDMIAFLTTNPQRLPVGSNGNVLTVVAGLPSWQPPAVAPPNQTIRDQAYLPTGWLYDSFSQSSANANYSLTSNLYNAIALPAGLTIGHIAFSSARTLVGQTHWWFGLFDKNLNMLATTADQLTAAWTAPGLPKSLAIAQVASGASTTFTTTYTGLHYLMLAVTATTGPLMVAANHPNSTNIGHYIDPTPAFVGSVGSTPPAFPFTETITSYTPQWAYCGVLA